MKKIINIFLSTAFCFIIYSCDKFIDVSPKGVIDEELAYSSPEEMVTAAYASLGDCWYTYPFNLWPYGDVSSDDCLKGGRDVNDTGYHPLEIWSSLTSSSVGEMDELWYRLYCNISRCNRALISLEQYGESKLGKIAAENLRFIDNEKFIINDSLLVKPFDVMHDACRTVGYRIESQNGKVAAISTDIGYVNNIVRENFKEVDIMVIESNYDYNMLMNCNYPWDLKARVKSRNGHLSNNEAAKFIKEMYNEKLKKVYLAHISKDSNNPDIVRDTIAQELRESRIRLEYELAKQDRATELFEL